jgi:predicted ArsR family transcriptional regulator
VENDSGNRAAEAATEGYGPRPATPRWEGRPLSPSRTAVLEALRDGAGTVAAIEQSTALHANTVRDHLDALVARGLAVRTRSAPSGRGRPAWQYEAAEPASATDGSEYAGLAAALAAHLHRTSTEPWCDAVTAGETWGHDLARRGGTPLRMSAVTARRRVLGILEEVGFAPETDARATTARLPRCPLLGTAKQYPDVVCGVHLGIVRGALTEYGADADAAQLLPFAEPGACRLHLTPASGRSHP